MSKTIETPTSITKLGRLVTIFPLIAFLITIFTLNVGSVQNVIEQSHRHVRQPKTINRAITDTLLKKLSDIPSMLRPHNLSVCLHRNGTDRDAGVPYQLIERDHRFSQRIRCYCLENHPVDNMNCILRLRNVTLFRNPTHAITEIFIDGAPSDFRVQAENSREIWSDAKLFINAKKGYFPKTEKSSKKRYRPLTVVPPYMEAFNLTESPVMLVSTLTIQDNYYHSMMGPSGMLQFVSTRDAINKFYFDHNKNLKPGESPVPFAPITQTTKYQFDSTSPRVILAKYGSCSRMEFTTPIGDDGSDGAQEMPLSYLSPSILYTFEHNNGMMGGPKSPMTWFGRRFGFCNQEMPDAVSILVDDLWVNLLYGQMGTQYAMRRKPIPKDNIVPGITFAEEYLTMCPLFEEERLASQWAASQITSVLSVYKSTLLFDNRSSVLAGNKPPLLSLNVTGAPKREEDFSHTREMDCLPVSRIHNRVEEKYCVLSLGRTLYPDLDRMRTRGVAKNLEHVILNTLLMPLDGLEPLVNTIQPVSPALAWDNDTRRDACAVDTEVHREAPTRGPVTSADVALETFNYKSGLPPCSTTTSEPPYFYNGLEFSNHSDYFPSHKLKRNNRLGKMSLPEQFAQISAANLFIMEEGSGATWSMNAKYGTTFIIVYNSNFVGFNATETQNKYLPTSYQPTSEFFTHVPDLFEKVRMIFFVYQYGRLPSFARLREAFDRPFKPESIIVVCECNTTRVLPRELSEPKCF